MSVLGSFLFTLVFFSIFILIPILLFLVFLGLYWIKITVKTMNDNEYAIKNTLDVALVLFFENIKGMLFNQADIFAQAFRNFFFTVYNYRKMLILLIVVFGGMFLLSEFQEEAFTIADRLYKSNFGVLVRSLVLSLLNILAFLYNTLSPVINFIVALAEYPFRALVYILRNCEPKFIVKLFGSIGEFIKSLFVSIFKWAENWFFFGAFDLKNPVSKIMTIVSDVGAFNNCTCQSVGNLYTITTDSLTKEFLPEFVNNTFNGVFYFIRMPVISFFHFKRPTIEPAADSFVNAVNNTALFLNFIIAETIPRLIDEIGIKFFSNDVRGRIGNVFLPGIPAALAEGVIGVANNSINLIFNVDRFSVGFAYSFFKKKTTAQVEEIEYSKGLLYLNKTFGYLRQFISIIGNSIDLFFLNTKLDFLREAPVAIVSLLIDYFEYIWNFLVNILFNGFGNPLSNIRDNIWYSSETDDLFNSMNNTMQAIIFIPANFLHAFIPTQARDRTVDPGNLINYLTDLYDFLDLITEILGTILSIILNAFRLYIDFWLNIDYVITYIFCDYNSNPSAECHGDPYKYDYIMNPNSSFSILLDEIDSNLVNFAVKTGDLAHFTDTTSCQGKHIKSCRMYYQTIQCYIGDIITTTLELAIYFLKYLVEVFRAIYSLSIKLLIPKWNECIRPRIIKISNDIWNIVFSILTMIFKSQRCPRACLSMYLASLMTSFLKFFLIVLDIIFAILDTLSAFFSNCDPLNPNCGSFNFDELVRAILGDTIGVFVSILNSCGDIYSCLMGGSSNFFFDLSAVFTELIQIIQGPFNEFFLDTFKFVVYFITGSFDKAFRSLVSLLFGILEGVKSLLYLIIEKIITLTFDAIISPIVQNTFMCDICTVFKWVARIATLGHAKIHCHNYCHATACFNDTQNAGTAKCPSPKDKRDFSLYGDDDDYLSFEKGNSDLNIKEMIGYMKTMEYIKTNNNKIQEHSTMLRNQFNEEKRKRDINGKHQQIRNFHEYGDEISLDQALKYPKLVGRMYSVLSDPITNSSSTNFPRITKESCLISLYSIQDKNFPVGTNLMNLKEKFEFKRLFMICSTITDIFEYSTTNNPPTDYEKYFQNNDKQTPSSCDKWIGYLKNIKPPSDVIEENFQNDIIEMHASKCIRERVLVSFVNRFLLQIGDFFRPYLLDKDFFNDPLIASSNLVRILFGIFNTGNDEKMTDKNPQYREFAKIFDGIDKKRYSPIFSVENARKLIAEKRSGQIVSNKRDQISKRTSQNLNQLQDTNILVPPNEPPSSLDFCMLDFTTNQYFFSFLSVFCKGQITISDLRIKNNLSKYCYREILEKEDIQIEPQKIITELCGVSKSYQKYVFEATLAYTKRIQKMFETKRTIQSDMKQLSLEESILNDKKAMITKHTPLSLDQKRSTGYMIKTYRENKININRKRKNYNKRRKLDNYSKKKVFSVPNFRKHYQSFNASDSFVESSKMFKKEVLNIYNKNKNIFDSPTRIYEKLFKEELLAKEERRRRIKRDRSLFLDQREATTTTPITTDEKIFNCDLFNNFVLYVKYELNLLTYYYNDCYPLYEEYFKQAFIISQKPIKPVCVCTANSLPTSNPYRISIDNTFLDIITSNRTSPFRNKTIGIFKDNIFTNYTKTALKTLGDLSSSIITQIYDNVPLGETQNASNIVGEKRDFVWYLKTFLICNNKNNFCPPGGTGLKKALLISLIILAVFLFIEKFLLPIELPISLFFYIIGYIILAWMIAYLYSPFCLPQLPTRFMTDLQDIVFDILPPYIKWGCFLSSSLNANYTKEETSITDNLMSNHSCGNQNIALLNCSNNYTSSIINNQINPQTLSLCYDLKMFTLEYSDRIQCPIPEVLLNKTEKDNQRYQTNLKKTTLFSYHNDSSLFIVCHIEFSIVDPIDSLLLATHIIFGKEYPLKFLDLNIPFIYEFMNIKVIKEKIERYKEDKYDTCSARNCFYFTSFMLIPIFFGIIIFLMLMRYLLPAIWSSLWALGPILFQYYNILSSLIFELFERDIIKPSIN